MANYDPNERRGKSLDEIEAEELAEKKKKFNLFDKFAPKESKGVDPDEIPIADQPTLLNFFKFIGRKFNQILTANIMLVVGNFPIFFFILAMSGYLSDFTTSPYYTVFAPLRGAMLFNQSPATSALWTIYSRQADIVVYTTADYVLFGLTALLLITWGPVNAGVTYLIRNLFRGKPVMMWQDFKDTVKRNFRQSLIYGILDIGIIVLIVYDIVFFWLNYNLNMVMSTLFFSALTMALLYFFMRPYIYLMIVTFDLSLFSMFKNALRFTVLGLKRNFMFLLGTVAVFLIEYFLMYAYFPLAVIVPFVILPSLLVTMGVYAAFPVIKKYMIDPFYEEVDVQEDEEEEY
ncbi:MAG: DUF624 domain-containing protein [Clostridia bacterium]|nr:DUF624 domain-containing protein [Clostridia bacterium]